MTDKPQTPDSTITAIFLCTDAVLPLDLGFWLWIISPSVPKWRNGRRRGFKIPRFNVACHWHQSPALGTIKIKGLRRSVVVSALFVSGAYWTQSTHTFLFCFCSCSVTSEFLIVPIVSALSG